LAIASAMAFLVCVTVAVSQAAEPLIALMDSPVLDTPFDRTLTLRSSTYVAYERTGRETADGQENTPTTLGPDSFTVTATDGTPVDLTAPALSSDTVSISGTVYTAVARFTAVTPGGYRLTSAASDGGQVLVGRSLGSGLWGLGPWLIGIGVAAAAGLVGLVLALVGLALRLAGPPPAR
jgi:hypothetical protein